METPISINLVDQTNILIREENTTTRDPLYGKEHPGTKITLKKKILSSIIPILKAFVIITLFIMNGSGYSPLSCKVQYLMSDKFWYNKQVIIFFIIYFIINLGGDTISKLTNPIQQLVLSICTLFLYNIIAKLGDLWWDKDPWYWPGPMSWFAVLVFPLLSVYILDDMRRYYIAENASFLYGNKIDIIKSMELGIILFTLFFIVWGFITATIKAKTEYKSTFSFFSFLFGAPLNNKPSCSAINFVKYRKELKTTKGNSNKYTGAMLVGGLLFITFSMGYIAIYKNYIEKHFLIIQNSLRNRAVKNE